MDQLFPYFSDKETKVEMFIPLKVSWLIHVEADLYTLVNWL